MPIPRIHAVFVRLSRNLLTLEITNAELQSYIGGRERLCSQPLEDVIFDEFPKVKLNTQLIVVSNTFSL
jgi:hypothetical protein